MKKVLLISILLGIIVIGCSKYSQGELIGVQGRKKYFEPDPYGMIFVPNGSFNMGSNEQDVTWAMTSQSKTVSVDAFWIDETEITNNEYRQFVYYVRDSIMRRILAQAGRIEFEISEDEDGNVFDPPYINWDEKIDHRDQEIREFLNEIYLSQDERFYMRKEIDTRKLMFEYYNVDLEQAAKKANRYNFETQEYEGYFINRDGERIEIENRSTFIVVDRINVYPDTLVWISDFTYSYNEPYAETYFWHPGYDNYPVVGVNWKQVRAFCIWRTKLLNDFLASKGNPHVMKYRLPLESEWEYAARGGLDLAPYPWGGMYTTNYEGCFLANFKPQRGRYTLDGALISVDVGTYEPNEWGIYDMAGNVAEWTENAYDESAYLFTHDMNPDYIYYALPEDPPVLKRKVIRGGSWKDIAYYLQCGTRTYEYQDTAKSYIGFRCVRSYLGGI